MADRKNKEKFLKLDKINKNLKRTSFLFNEFYVTSVKYKTLAYLRKDLKGWLLMNKLMEYYYAKKDLSVEELVKMIDSKVCSRATFLKLLNDCIYRKILTKIKDDKDKRIKILKPTPQFVDEFEKWTEEFYTDSNWEIKTDYKKF
jgi:DNA-binding MarR family transcriptional regulator